ncbi:GNAT family N-acetyltransferase [Vibrio aquimaris]|uniref:Ribosomal-protein-S5-alanine N-acetyltransferase n=1 Tax=Vibrio aquimaris TaxID=2587862 RepID=A0A5P9CQA1_9VIBR|nr:GNAT family N-acetyltransferase [Vibrio aquimaris]QFT28394.1 ribosomal-protein-S5-alanine N-acetyltransferase [Vibrio aquimaris]
MQPSIETPRLLLRPFRLSDSQRVALLAGQKIISDMTANIPYPYTEEMANEWIGTHSEKFEHKSAVIFAITLKGSDSIVGAVSFPSLKSGVAILGYWLGTDYWGKGIALEASQALIGYAKRELKVSEVEAQHLANNHQSSSVIRKLGMQYKENRFVQIRGKPREVCVYRSSIA